MKLSNRVLEMEESVTFGRYQDKPIWEVKSGSDFYLVDFETGALVNKEGL